MAVGPSKEKCGSGKYKVCLGTVRQLFSGAKAKSGEDRRKAELVLESRGAGAGGRKGREGDGETERQRDGESAMSHGPLRAESTCRVPESRPIKLHSPHQGVPFFGHWLLSRDGPSGIWSTPLTAVSAGEKSI